MAQTPGNYDPDARIARRDALRGEVLELCQQLKAPSDAARRSLLSSFSEVHPVAVVLADQLSAG